MEIENNELTEQNTKLEIDRKMFQSASEQLIEEKHQLETTVKQVQAENNQLKAENKILRNQIAPEIIRMESQYKEEKFRLESYYQKEKEKLLSEIELLTIQLKHISTVSVDKKLLVSIHCNSYDLFVETVWVLKDREAGLYM